MKRVVITGMGIWSSIGQDLQTVTESLKQGRSGIVFDPSWVEYGLRSGLVGAVSCPDLKSYLPRKTRQMMSDNAGYAYMAARQAFNQAGISDEYLRQNEVGIIFGNDGNSHQHEYAAIMDKEHSSILVGYNAAYRVMTSNTAACLASIFHLRGINLTTAAACASSSHALGVAFLFIQQGLQNMIIVGGGDETRHDNVCIMVNDALYKETHFNNPTQTSRPFDINAVGCIPTGGAAALILEEYEHAVARGANILAEVSGYGFYSDGYEDMTRFPWEADYQAMNQAVEKSALCIEEISLIHSRADAFPLSDRAEAIALAHVCNGKQIPITSTEGMTGHGGLATNRIVYSVLMMQNNFIAPTINLEHPIDEAKDLNIITETTYTPIDTVLVNSAGLGGSHSAIVLRKI